MPPPYIALFLVYCALFLVSPAQGRVEIEYPLNSSSVAAPIPVKFGIDISNFEEADRSAIEASPEAFAFCYTLVGLGKSTCSGLLDVTFAPIPVSDFRSHYTLEAWIAPWDSATDPRGKIGLARSTFFVEHAYCDLGMGSWEEEEDYSLLAPLGTLRPLCRVPGVVAANVPEVTWQRRQTDMFATHQPALVHYARGSSFGDIWEIGCGRGSTPLLRQIAKESGRRLYTVEGDDTWLTQVERRMRPANYHTYVSVHRVLKDESSHLGSNLGNREGEQNLHWVHFFRSSFMSKRAHEGYSAAVAFVDNSPMAAR